MKAIIPKFLVLGLVLALFGCTDDNEITPVRKQAVAVITSLDDNSVIGNASFLDVGNGVVLTINLEGLDPGSRHASHLHIGTCDNIGPHWNPTNDPHGRRGVTDEFHRGDIGNIEIGSDGKGSLTLTAPDWSVGGDSDTDVMGKILIVHAGVDDYVTQPDGNSGPPVGCGVVQ